MNGDGDHKYLRYFLMLVLIPFGVGLFIGLVIFGWWLWPVEYIDTEPNSLRHSYQTTYIALVADSFALNNDIELARSRLSSWSENELEMIFNEVVAVENNLGHNREVQNIQRLMAEISIAEVHSIQILPEATPRTPLGEAIMYMCISSIVGAIFASFAVGSLQYFVRDSLKNVS